MRKISLRSFLKYGVSAAPILLGLAACGSGGGGDAAPAGSNVSNSGGAVQQPATIDQNLPEPSASLGAAGWFSTEYSNSTGLSMIKAAEAYAGRTGGSPAGSGIRVAIIDQGIDLDHPDLQTALDGQPSFVFSSESGPAASSHGTHVAGIVAAARDSGGRHGVAYRASLVNIQGTRPSLFGGDFENATFDSVDLAIAIGSAAGIAKCYGTGVQCAGPNAADYTSNASFSSQIINMSLGGSSPVSKVLEAMRDAAAQERILVISSGNDSDTEPSYPARYATDGLVAGYAVVVGNLQNDNTPRPSSNDCGTQAAYCLMAPGTNIYSTLPGAAYGFGTGTSMAAPQVAGALAVLKAAFPGVSNASLVQRILDTAAPLPYAATIVGQGLLDLEAAINPVGIVSVSGGGGSGGGGGGGGGGLGSMAEATTFSLAPAFGVQSGGYDILSSVMGLDEQGFPFFFDLNQQMATQERRTGLESFVSSDQYTTVQGIAGTNFETAFFVDQNVTDSVLPFWSLLGPDPRGRALTETPAMARASGSVTKRLSYFAGINTSPADTVGALQPFTRAGAEFLSGATFFSPYEDLAGPSMGGGIGWALTPNLTVKVAGFQSSAEFADGQEADLARFEMAYVLDTIELRVGVGHMSQQGGALGSIADGAFDVGQNSSSNFATVSIAAPITDRVTVFASYTDGVTNQQSANGLITDISDARANAFGVGVSARDVMRKNDGVTFVVGQPLRVASSRTTVTVPVSLSNGEAVTFDTADINLAADAREIALEAVYSTPVASESTVSFGLFGRLNPDHNPNAAPDIGVGTKFSHRF